MATTNEMVEQVSQDTGDYWKSTTTGAGSVTTLVDTALINEDDDDFVTDRSQIHLLSGAASGESAGFDTKLGATLTVKTNADFSDSTGSGTSYEVHRLFTRKEKEDAITRALETVFPTLFTIKKEEVTVIASQHTYTTTNFTYLRQPAQALIESDFDTELDTEIHDWEMLPEDDKIRFNIIPEAGRLIILRGILLPLIAEITESGQKQILSAAACIELYQQMILNAPGDNVSRWERARQLMDARLKERIRKFGPVAMAWTLRTNVYGRTIQSSSRRA